MVQEIYEDISDIHEIISLALGRDEYTNQSYSLEDTLQAFHTVLGNMVELGHREHELESAILQYKIPYLKPSVLAKSAGSYGKALYNCGFNNSVVDWIMEQCDHLHPVFGITNRERRNQIISLIRTKQLHIRKSGA